VHVHECVGIQAHTRGRAQERAHMRTHSMTLLFTQALTSIMHTHRPPSLSCSACMDQRSQGVRPDGAACSFQALPVVSCPSSVYNNPNTGPPSCWRLSSLLPAMLQTVTSSPQPSLQHCPLILPVPASRCSALATTVQMTPLASTCGLSSLSTPSSCSTLEGACVCVQVCN